MDKFAHNIESTEFSFAPLQCGGTSNRNAQLSHQKASIERLTQTFYSMFHTPMFTLGLSCCSMPQQSEIATAWRLNIDKIKNFLRLIETGVSGQVENGKGEPLRDAHLRFIGSDQQSVYNVSQNAARFNIILPPGTYQLEVRAAHYEMLVREVEVKPNQINELGSITLSEYTLLTGHVEAAQGSATKLASTNVKTSATISGFVLDVGNHPIANAKLSIKNTKLSNLTDSMGTYSLTGVQSGDVTLYVEAAHHDSAERLLHMGTTGASVAGVVFRLTINDSVLGLPRMLFIILASIGTIIAVVLCIMGTQYILARRSSRFDKHYYNFSMLPQKSKELFEDEEGETELFRSPIKSEF